MKKLIIFVLLLCSIFQTRAETWTDGNGMSWTFTASGSVATNVKPTDKSSISGDVVIPAKVYNGATEYAVTSIAYEAFYNCSAMTSVTIPASITSIATQAFYRCNGLTKVIVPDIAAWCHVSFGDNASNPLTYAHRLYSNANTEITELVIPSGVTSIGEKAFRDCTGLTSISLPEGVTTIGEEAFRGCTALASVSVPNSLESVGDDAFLNTPFFNNQTGVVYLGKIAYRYAGTMPSNTVIDIREGTTAIAQSAFKFNANLVGINIPSSVKTIGERAFQSCDGLTSIIIPEGVTTVGDFAFMWSENLSSVSLPSTLKSISRSMFKSCTALTSVTIPEGVTSIGLSAFDGCTSLTSVSIPSTVTSIADEMCYDCSSLTVVYNYRALPQTITSDAFTNRANATLYVPAGSKAAYEAADYWKQFHIVEMSDDVEMIDIVLNGDLEGADLRCFYSKEAVGDYAGTAVPSTIAEGAGKDGSNGVVVHSVDNPAQPWDTQFFIRLPQTLPAGTKFHISFDYKASQAATCSTQAHAEPCDYIYWYGIGDVNCTTEWKHFELTGAISENQSTAEKPMRTFAFNLSEIATANTYYFDNIVVEIDKPHYTGIDIRFADANVKALCLQNWDTNGNGELSEDEAAAVSSLGNVFKENTDIISFDELRYFTGITELPGWNAFNGCSALTSITIPAGVNRIGGAAFANCPSLKSLCVDPANDVFDSRDNCNAIVETATNKLVVGCDSTHIPNGITTIGSDAFWGRWGMQTITIPESVTTIEENAFAWCISMTYVTLPASVSAIGDGAFQNVPLTDVTALNPEPVAITENVFTNRANARIRVLSGSRAAYKAADYWKDFIWLIMGDVNDDGEVDVADAVTIVNRIIGKPTPAFIEEAADVNYDIDIDVADAVTIVNFIIGKISSFESNAEETSLVPDSAPEPQ